MEFMRQKIETIEQLIHLLANRGGVPQPGMRYTWPAFRLARYDVGFVQNISSHLLIRGATTLTDAQYALCVKLARKYRKQLLKSDYDFGQFNWDDPIAQSQIVELDRTRSVVLAAGRIRIQFRFDSALVAAMNELSKCAQGEFEWDRANKIWTVWPGLANIRLIVPWAIEQGFEVDPELVRLYEQINSSNVSVKYAVVKDNGVLAIPDAPDRLQQAVAELFESQDLLSICWQSTRYGYNISSDVKQEMDQIYRSQLTYFDLAQDLIYNKVVCVGSLDALATTLNEIKTVLPGHNYAISLNNLQDQVDPILDIFEGTMKTKFVAGNLQVAGETERKFRKLTALEMIDDYFDLTVFDSTMYNTGLRRSLITQATNKIVVYTKP
jgi:hypothetical protein